MSGMFASWAGHALGRLGESLANEDKRKLLFGRIWRGLRIILRLGIVGYLVFLTALWGLFRHWGEGNLTLAFLLYLPPVVWVLPLLPLLGVALLTDWKALLLGTGAGALVLSGLFAWQFNSGDFDVVAGERVLRVFSYNRGQSQGATQRPFIEEVKPDILLFQEAPARWKQMVEAPGYERFQYGDSIGEFTLLSRYPILSKALIRHQNLQVAARFTLDWEGTEVAVYSVHLYSPRDALMAMRRGAFLWGVLGVPGTKWADKRRANEQFWKRQIGSAEAILKSCREEKLPYVVAGDFNAPSQGHIHHLLTRELNDSHEVSGWGGGYTFPGKTGNPLAFRSPWLRIDKILYSDHWKSKWSVVEPEQPSQHRALAAGLILKAAEG
jgi:vancomycin resistance protein VanJ